jgi:LppX/LprAFG-like lipoprotein
MPRSLLLISLVLVALVAGCGGDGGGGAPNPLALLDLAVDRTKDVDSVRQSATMESDLGGQKMAIEIEGSATALGEDGEMTMTMETGGDEFEADVILVDGVFYMKSKAIPLPAGKEWLKSEDVPASSLDPGELVQHLREAQGVKRVGSEEIRGEPTTHFRGPIDIEKLVDASFGGRMAEQFKQIPNVREFSMTIDVWVLEDGLPARTAVKLTAPQHIGGSMSMTAEFLEYDVPIDVEAPPDRTVIDESELGQAQS